LKIDFKDLKNAICCPDPIVNRVMEPLKLLSISSFNIASAQAAGANAIATPCNGCYASLSRASEQIESPEVLSRLNMLLHPFDLKITSHLNVKHIVDVLFENKDRIAAMIDKPLKGLRVATHLGCHFFSGEHIRDMKKTCTMIDQIVEVLGAQPVGYTLKSMCCGGSLRGYSEDLMESMILRKIFSAKEARAHCLVTSCPLCILNLDGKQKVIERKMKLQMGLPVMALQEIVALAFGFNIGQIGLQYHMTDATKLLQDFHFL
jgi:heterodisulfide reductase subunit B